MNDSYLQQINLKNVTGFEAQSLEDESPLKTTDLFEFIN